MAGGKMRPMAKKVWKKWKLLFGCIEFKRDGAGRLLILISGTDKKLIDGLWMTRNEARRLFQKLAGDYRD